MEETFVTPFAQVLIHDCTLISSIPLLVYMDYANVVTLLFSPPLFLPRQILATMHRVRHNFITIMGLPEESNHYLRHTPLTPNPRRIPLLTASNRKLSLDDSKQVSLHVQCTCMYMFCTCMCMSYHLQCIMYCIIIYNDYVYVF